LIGLELLEAYPIATTRIAEKDGSRLMTGGAKALGLGMKMRGSKEQSDSFTIGKTNGSCHDIFTNSLRWKLVSDIVKTRNPDRK
jgi:hypothetical protein